MARALAALLLRLLLVVPASGAEAGEEPRRAGALRGLGAATGAAQQPCGASAVCRGCSGEQCGLCEEEEQVKCCLSGGGSREACCAAAGSQVRGRPVCQASCDTEAACQGCSGEQCSLCREEEQVKCCVRGGGSQEECCAAASAQIRMGQLCHVSLAAASAGHGNCHARRKCRGCSGEQCTLCEEEEHVKCCVKHGGSQADCCAATASWEVRARPVCKPTCDTQARCRGCGGEQCSLCREEEQVKCCMRDGGSREQCCGAATAAIRARPLCQPPATPRPCTPEEDCRRAKCRPGVECMTCYAKERVKCCLRAGGSKQLCCSNAGPAIQASHVCK